MLEAIVPPTPLLHVYTDLPAFGPLGMLPTAGVVPSGPHPVQVPEIRPDQHLQMPASASCGASSGTGMPPGAAINHSSKSPAESSLLPAQDPPTKRISCLDVSLSDVFKYIECPRQCSKCQRFGHVAGACRLPMRCPRCGGNHDRSSCATEQLQCPNCKKQHESTSSRCRVLRKEKEIHNYKINHNVGYISAMAAIYEKRKAASRSSNDGTTVSCKDACKTASENPPRIEDTEEFPSLPTRNLPLSPCVTAAKESTQGSGVRVQESTSAAGSSERRGPSVSRGQRERSTRQDNSITYSLLSALVDAARSFLAPISSPIAKVILTLLDFLSPVIERWR
ncbi:hypothetical protein HPB50_002994 [Hyalomma asiaticum]|uniref:Uncharacterized protein n=1 Tax=Hyalomma asiaticum TaxID=266040 RepID=A0ACB7SM91_HYAAI|nr:hypothetical protein HPB50_002994 [Hyalomma asiaticum]